MNKKIIVRIAEGIGNQLFMYAHAYALSRKINCDLLIDNTSGYFQKKNQLRSYELNKFNINTNLCDPKDRFDNFLTNLNRSFLKKINLLKKNKQFLIEYRDKNKITYYYDTSKLNFSNLLYVEGNFESEKYFKDFTNELNKSFLINEKYLIKNNKYINLLKNTNSVSISVRQHRFSERGIANTHRSNEFTKKTVDYVSINNEKEIMGAMKYLYTHFQIKSEGAGALPTASFIYNKNLLKSYDYVLIPICGKNIHDEIFKKLLN